MSIVWVTLMAGAAAFGTAGLVTLVHAARSGAFENVEETKFVVFRGEDDSNDSDDSYDEPPQ
jgi:hypothetical protein